LHARCADSLSPKEARRLAIELVEHPMPEFLRVHLERRWVVGPDTVRKVLRRSAPDLNDERPVPFTTVLECEGHQDPLRDWLAASPGERSVLLSDLLTFDDYAQFIAERTGMKISAWRRHLAGGPDASVRIGKQHRFRPDTRAAEKLRAAKQSAVRTHTPEKHPENPSEKTDGG
jgi:hypothetical protein